MATDLAPQASPSRAVFPIAGLSVVVLAVAVIVAVLTGDPTALAEGWLAGWLFALSVTTGAVLWFLIVRLTGGGWIGAGAPALAVLSASVPLVALTGLVFVAAAPLLYPWWIGPAVMGLTPLTFGFRAVLCLAVFSALGFAAPRALSPGLAALALIAYVAAIGLAGTDWILSRDSRFGSTVFFASLGAIQLTLGLAAVAVAGLDDARRQAVADWGALLLATVLGTLYLLAMQYLVMWTGNLPADAAWYGARDQGGGGVLVALAFLLAAAVPFVALLSTRLRGDAGWLRWIGGAVLAGGLAHLLWLVAPGAPPAALLTALATVGLLTAMALLWGARR